MNSLSKIHLSIFGSPPSPFLEKKYIQSLQIINSSHTPEDIEKIEPFFTKSINLVALEFYTRRSGKFPLLSAYFQTVLYIAETDPLLKSNYILKDNVSIINCIFILLNIVFRSTFLYLKGAVIYASSK